MGGGQNVLIPILKGLGKELVKLYLGRLQMVIMRPVQEVELELEALVSMEWVVLTLEFRAKFDFLIWFLLRSNYWLASLQD